MRPSVVKDPTVIGLAPTLVCPGRGGEVGSGPEIAVAKERPSSVPPGPPDVTLPQWKPPASATLDMPVSGTRTRGEDVPVSGTRTRGEDLPFAQTTPAVPVTVPSGPPKPLEPGDVVADRYIVEEHVSSGGFGAVYRASDKQIRNHQVAIKVLHVPAASEEARDAALRELTLIASVSHPSVVQFKDYGWLDGRLWFAMPWYRGKTLDERMATDGMSRAEARPVFERLAQGLAAMHEVGVQHHDIKPENIFLADIAGFEGGLPVLLDLGIAAERGEGPKGLTLDYAAPETAASALGDKSEPIGEPADVFSLALVLRNLLEPETRPPSGLAPLAMLRRRASEPVPPPEGKDFRHMRAAFQRWLAIDPMERPTAAELAREVAILTAPEERRQARMRLLRRLLPVVAIAGLLVAVLWLQLRQQETQIVQQAELLSEEMRASAQLRERTQNQLAQLESQTAQLGSQERDLRKAISIARDLDSRLQRSQQEGDGLQKRVKRLTGERDTLTEQNATLVTERDGLQSERDQLEQTRQRLTQQRDGLIAERDDLQRERDSLSAERDRVSAERDALLERRRKLEADLNAIEAQLASAEKARAAMQKERDEMAVKREAIKAENETLERANKKLDAERVRLAAKAESLEKRLALLERKLRAPRRGKATPAPTP